MVLRTVALLAALLPLTLPLVSAHGTGDAHLPNPIRGPNEPWVLYHLRSEHHLSNFDAGAFFSLHDFDASGFWSKDEILRFYGLLQDDCAPEIAHPDNQQRVLNTVLGLMDYDENGEVSREEWMRFCNEQGDIYDGGKGADWGLPDLGTGPGHHGDDEYEYEIHHFEQFHGGDDVDEADLVHEEDIAHFRKHAMEDEQADRQAVLERTAVNVANIPQKFRVQR